MALPVLLDIRFVNDDTGLGDVVDQDLSVQIFQAGAVTVTETRALGTDSSVSIVQGSDAQGTFYYTYIDASNYVQGRITAKWYANQLGIQVDPFPTVLTAEYPIASGVNSDSIRQYVFNMLGFPSVAVELTSGQLATCMNEALTVYNRWCARELSDTVVLSAGIFAYPLPGVGSRGVADVQFVRKQQLNLTSFPFFGREFPIWPQIQFDEFVLSQSHWETVRRQASVEPEWTWRVENGTLYISLGGPSGSQDPSLYDVSYRYYADVAIDQIPVSHHAWFRQYALAVAKEILGRTRGKWSGTVPSPGGTLTLDAAQLLDESRQDRQRLEDDLRSLAPAVPPVWG